MFKACKQNVKVIKTIVTLKIEIKEKSPFLWFYLSLYAIIKNYISPEREINAEFDKTNGNFICWINHKL